MTNNDDTKANLYPQKKPTLLIPSPLLTVKEVQQYLKISRSAVYGLIDKGELPTLKFGRCVRVDRRDLARFMDDHRQIQSCGSVSRGGSR